MKFTTMKKYKRFFTFGCSFTSHVYPTWAHVVASEMPDAKFYNFGSSGGGNLFITVRLAEANVRFNFNEDDLIMVMFSTFYREDRWFNGKWQLGGNVYNNAIYDDEFVKKYSDPSGYVIRDLGLIEASTKYIESLPCDHFFMMAANWNSERKHGDSGGPIEEKAFAVYDKTLKKFPPSMLELELNGAWSPQVQYIRNDGVLVQDPHPRPRIYKNYLEKIGLPLTQRSEDYVQDAEAKLAQCKTHKDLEKAFVNEFKAIDDSFRHMF